MERRAEWEFDPARVAFVHEWLTSYGGAERVLETMLELFPQAPIYTLVHEPSALGHSPLAQAQVHTSFVNRLPWAKRSYRRYLPLMPLAVEQLDLRGYQLVISFSHSLAHGVLLGPDQLHLNYIYTPARFAWHQHQDYLDTMQLRSGLRGALTAPLLHYLRLWDQAASQRVDRFAAISEWIASAVERSYRRPARVIYPPVNVDLFKPRQPRGDHYVVVGRLVPNKHIDLIVRSCSSSDRALVVIGDGPERRRLERLASGRVRIAGWLSDKEVVDLVGRARAFIHAAEEDFGIAPVEAQAAGCPLIAYSRGGLTETVIEGETGLFFHERTVADLQAALARFEAIEDRFDPSNIRHSVLRFGKQRFQDEMMDFIQGTWAEFAAGRPQP